MRAIDYIIEQIRKEAVIRTALKAGKKVRRNFFGKKVLGKTKPVAEPTPVPKPVEKSSLGDSGDRRPNLVREPGVPNDRKGVEGGRSREGAPAVTGGIQIPATDPTAAVVPATNSQGTQKINWTEQFRKWYDKDPVKTVAMTGGGLYLGKNVADQLTGNNKSGMLSLNKYASKFIGK